MCDSQHSDAHDNFGPPEIPTLVRCLHCGEEYESFNMVWRENAGHDKARLPGFWCCPTAGCRGKGFGLDIWALDSSLDPDSEAAMESGVGPLSDTDPESDVFGEHNIEFELNMDNVFGSGSPEGSPDGFPEDPFAVGDELFQPEAELEFFDDEVAEGDWSGVDEGWEGLEPEFDHLLWSDLEYTGHARADGLIGDPAPIGFIDPNQEEAFTEHLDEIEDEDIPF